MVKTGIYFEDIVVGQTAEMAHTVTDGDLRAFAAVSGDDNPVHLDAEFAATTQFKERIAHGMLTAAFISAVIGTKLPGYGSIYISQTLQFRRPVKLGDTVTTKVTVTELEEKRGRVTLACVCSVDGKSVLEGEAVAMAPRKG